jgi:glycosyltransferase involved in cell wall biosynthesis
MVVHDVAAVVAPALYGAPKRLRYELLLRGSLRRASHVVCVSQATLLDLHRWSGVPAGKCTVIGNAPQPLGRGAGVRPFDRPYLLMVGDLYGNKNTRTVLEALADLRDRGAAVSHLIIVGPLPKSTAARLERDCEELGITGHVHHRGFVGAGALADLYRGAVALIYPSLYEGQGIPVMEAEMCGAAVIATDLPSLREFAGAGVTFVGRPLDPAAWTAAILQRLGGPRRPAEAARPYEDWRDVGRRLAGTLRAAATGAAAAPS